MVDPTTARLLVQISISSCAHVILYSDDLVLASFLSRFLYQVNTNKTIWYREGDEEKEKEELEEKITTSAMLLQVRSENKIRLGEQFGDDWLNQAVYK